MSNVDDYYDVMCFGNGATIKDTHTVTRKQNGVGSARYAYSISQTHYHIYTQANSFEIVCLFSEAIFRAITFTYVMYHIACTRTNERHQINERHLRNVFCASASSVRSANTASSPFILRIIYDFVVCNANGTGSYFRGFFREKKFEWKWSRVNLFQLNSLIASATMTMLMTISVVSEIAGSAIFSLFSFRVRQWVHVPENRMLITNDHLDRCVVVFCGWKRNSIRTWNPRNRYMIRSSNIKYAKVWWQHRLATTVAATNEQ